jgi:hypothetical protein
VDRVEARHDAAGEEHEERAQQRMCSVVSASCRAISSFGISPTTRRMMTGSNSVTRLLPPGDDFVRIPLRVLSPGKRNGGGCVPL